MFCVLNSDARSDSEGFGLQRSQCIVNNINNFTGFGGREGGWDWGFWISESET